MTPDPRTETTLWDFVLLGLIDLFPLSSVPQNLWVVMNVTEWAGGGVMPLYRAWRGRFF